MRPALTPLAPPPVLISPGPGTPHTPADVGVCLPLLRECAQLPVLGVCLGHQALAVAHGARVVRAPAPVHGQLSAVTHRGHALFDGIPSGEAFSVRLPAAAPPAL